MFTFCALKTVLVFITGTNELYLCGQSRRFGGLYTNSAAGGRVVEDPGYGLSQCHTSGGLGFKRSLYISIHYTVLNSVHEPEDSWQDVSNCGSAVKTVVTQSGKRSQCKLIQRNTMPGSPPSQTLAIELQSTVETQTDPGQPRGQGGIEQLHSGPVHTL